MKERGWTSMNRSTRPKPGVPSSLIPHLSALLNLLGAEWRVLLSRSPR